MTPDTVFSVDQVLRDGCDGGMMTAICERLLEEGDGLVAQDKVMVLCLRLFQAERIYL